MTKESKWTLAAIGGAAILTVGTVVFRTTPKVITKKVDVVVTPTQAPIATPSAALKLESKNGKVILPTGLTKVGKAASATAVKK